MSKFYLIKLMKISDSQTHYYELVFLIQKKIDIFLIFVYAIL